MTLSLPNTTNVWGDGDPEFIVPSPDLQRLEAARRRHRITITAWARRAGVSESNTRGILKGRIRPKLATLAYLAVAVGLTIEDVLEGDGTPIPSLKRGFGSWR